MTYFSIATLVMLLLSFGCGRPQPEAPTIIGRWTETNESLRVKYESLRALSPSSTLPPTESRVVELFKDGTGAAIAKGPLGSGEPSQERTSSFTWSLSADGQRIKTEWPDLGRTFVQRIVKLTHAELQTEGPGVLAGSYVR